MYNLYNPKRTRYILNIGLLLLTILVNFSLFYMPNLWYIEIAIWLCVMIATIKMNGPLKKDEARIVFEQYFPDYKWHRMVEIKPEHHPEPGIERYDVILVARIRDPRFSHLLHYIKTSYFRREGESEEDWDISSSVAKTIGLREFKKLMPYQDNVIQSEEERSQ